MNPHALAQRLGTYATVDTETTGTGPDAGIVQLAIVVQHADGRLECLHRRLNPGQPISPEATAVHGLTDADVAGEPVFAEFAPVALEMLSGKALLGFNLAHFDCPLLERHFTACGLTWRWREQPVIDAYLIHKRLVSHALPHAARYYTGRTHAGAHEALADVWATIAVCEEQLRTHPELHGLDAAGLSDWCRPPDRLSECGSIVWREGEARWATGKHAGKSLRELAASNPGFLRWVLDKDFGRDVRQLCLDALHGRFPTGARAA